MFFIDHLIPWDIDFFQFRLYETSWQKVDIPVGLLWFCQTISQYIRNIFISGLQTLKISIERALSTCVYNDVC